MQKREFEHTPGVRQDGKQGSAGRTGKPQCIVWNNEQQWVDAHLNCPGELVGRGYNGYLTEVGVEHHIPADTLREGAGDVYSCALYSDVLAWIFPFQ